MATQRGFTLIELMVALAVLAVVLGVGVPSYQGYIAEQRVKSASQSLFMGLLLARSEAIKRNQTISISPNGSWQQGWVISTGASYDDCLSNAAGCIRVAQPARRIEIDTAAGALSFQRSGRLQGGGSPSFAFCDSDAQATQRVVQLDLSGRPVVRRGGQCT